MYREPICSTSGKTACEEVSSKAHSMCCKFNSSDHIHRMFLWYLSRQDRYHLGTIIGLRHHVAQQPLSVSVVFSWLSDQILISIIIKLALTRKSYFSTKAKDLLIAKMTSKIIILFFLSNHWHWNINVSKIKLSLININIYIYLKSYK